MNGNELEEKIVTAVRAWFRRAAPQLRRQHEVASLEIQLAQPGADDDGTLHLEAQLKETLIELEGRVEGVNARRSISAGGFVGCW